MCLVMLHMHTECRACGGGGASSLKSQISVFVTRDDANFGVCRILSPTHAN